MSEVSFLVEQARCRKDLLRVFHNNTMYINEKGYLQKLIEIMYNMGYYVNNESIFIGE